MYHSVISINNGWFCSIKQFFPFQPPLLLSLCQFHWQLFYQTYSRLVVVILMTTEQKKKKGLFKHNYGLKLPEGMEGYFLLHMRRTFKLVGGLSAAGFVVRSSAVSFFQFPSPFQSALYNTSCIFQHYVSFY